MLLLLLHLITVSISYAAISCFECNWKWPNGKSVSENRLTSLPSFRTNCFEHTHTPTHFHVLFPLAFFFSFCNFYCCYFVFYLYLFFRSFFFYCRFDRSNRKEKETLSLWINLCKRDDSFSSMTCRRSDEHARNGIQISFREK